MQVTIEDLSPVEKKLDIEIPWEQVSRRLDEAYRDLSRGVQLRGFRRGKVPRSMLERMFGKTVEQEVLGKLVNEGFIQIAHEQNLHPVAEPVVDEAKMPAKPGEPLKFTARVEIRTEVKPQKYEELELKRREPNVRDEDVDRALERKRQELTEYRVIEGRESLGPTDVLIVGLRGTIGDTKFEREEMRVDLAQTEAEPIPGLAAALRGRQLAQKSIALELEIPADHPRKELAGKKASLAVTIQEAREKLVPELDDDFAKDTGEADTLVDLREHLRKHLLEADQKEVERELRRGLVEELLRRNEFDVAPALIERQLDVMIERTKIQLTLQGVDVRKGFDENPIREELRSGAKDEVRAALLIDAIADAEKVTVSDAEVDKHVTKLAAARETNPQKLKAEWKKEGRLEAVRHSLREEKTLDLLLSRTKISVEQSRKSESKKDL